MHTTLTVRGSELFTGGDPKWGGFEETVIIGAGRRELRYPADGEEWARHLPSAFRARVRARVIWDDRKSKA